MLILQYYHCYFTTSSSKCYHFNTYLLFDFSTAYGGGGGGGGVVVMEASSGSGVQLVDGSTTIEVDGGARGDGNTYSRYPNGHQYYHQYGPGYGGSDGALFIVSNSNIILVCK